MEAKAEVGRQGTERHGGGMQVKAGKGKHIGKTSLKAG
jgi:hypothetical protein